SQIELARPERIQPSERVAQEVERFFRQSAYACLLLVHGQLQLPHDPAHRFHGGLRSSRSRADHEVVRDVDRPSLRLLLRPPRVPRAATNRRMYKLANRGEATPPCGVPRPSSLLRVVRCFRPCSSVSSTGASSHILTRCSMCRSLTRRATDLISSAWGIVSKYPLKSASTTSVCPARISPVTALRASCWLRPAR